MSYNADFKINGMDVELHFDYSAEEPITNYYPGNAECLEINKLIIDGKDHTKALQLGNLIEYFEGLILNESK